MKLKITPDTILNHEDITSIYAYLSASASNIKIEIGPTHQILIDRFENQPNLQLRFANRTWSCQLQSNVPIYIQTTNLWLAAQKWKIRSFSLSPTTVAELQSLANTIIPKERP